jgi:hypothetical protein
MRLWPHLQTTRLHPHAETVQAASDSSYSLRVNTEHIFDRANRLRGLSIMLHIHGVAGLMKFDYYTNSY